MALPCAWICGTVAAGAAPCAPRATRHDSAQPLRCVRMKRLRPVLRCCLPWLTRARVACALAVALARRFCRTHAEDPLVGAIAQEYIADREKHDKTAAEWTRRYAQCVPSAALRVVCRCVAQRFAAWR